MGQTLWYYQGKMGQIWQHKVSSSYPLPHQKDYRNTWLAMSVEELYLDKELFSKKLCDCEESISEVYFSFLSEQKQ